MLQLTKSGPIFLGSARDVERLQLQFQQQNFIRLPQFLNAELLNLIQERLNGAEFYERVHEGIGTNRELCMHANFLQGFLHFLLNAQEVFHLIEQISGCDQINSFEGRVYRVISGRGHEDAWHSDTLDHRLVAISINLSEEVYSGGILQIRDINSKQTLQEVANTGYGDGILFRLADQLQHRITEMEGTAPKTAYAGWFKSEPNFLSLLKEQSELI